MAQHARRRPAGELDLRDELGVGEDRVGDRLAGRERRLTARDALQPLSQLGAVGVAVAHPDLADVAQTTMLVAMPDEQGAQAVRATHVALEPAADHELLALRVLDLRPRAAATARLIAAVQPLGDDALEPLLPRRAEQLRAVAPVIGRR